MNSKKPAFKLKNELFTKNRENIKASHNYVHDLLKNPPSFSKESQTTVPSTQNQKNLDEKKRNHLNFFQTKTFFLDIKNETVLKSVTQQFTSQQIKISSTFPKDVDCVVTDYDHSKLKQVLASAHKYKDESPVVEESPFASWGSHKTSIFTSQNQMRERFLQSAKNRSITVVHYETVDRAFKSCFKDKKFPPLFQSQSLYLQSDFYEFKHGYICIDDISYEYKPLFKEYTAETEPALYLETPPNHCPFLKPPQKTEKKKFLNSDKQVIGLLEKLNMKKKGISASKLAEESEARKRDRILLLEKKTKEMKNLFENPSVKENDDRNNKKNKKPGFCECCNVKYSDYDKHRKSVLHREYADKLELFEELDDLIEELKRPEKVVLDPSMDHDYLIPPKMLELDSESENYFEEMKKRGMVIRQKTREEMDYKHLFIYRPDLDMTITKSEEPSDEAEEILEVVSEKNEIQQEPITITDDKENISVIRDEEDLDDTIILSSRKKAKKIIIDDNDEISDIKSGPSDFQPSPNHQNKINTRDSKISKKMAEVFGNTDSDITPSSELLPCIPKTPLKPNHDAYEFPGSPELNVKSSLLSSRFKRPLLKSSDKKKRPSSALSTGKRKKEKLLLDILNDRYI